MKEIDRLLEGPPRYLDPVFSQEPSTGKYLHERWREQKTLIARDIPSLSDLLPSESHVPTTVGQNLDHRNRRNLRRLKGDIEDTFQLLLT